MERILLIEDDQALGRGTALALAGEGREIRVAATLAQGWAALGEGEYALVLLDLNLPDGNGLDFLTALRRTSGVPVLILTANDLESDQVAGLELGADDYVTKPYNPAVLLARIQSVLRRAARTEPPSRIEHKGVVLDVARSRVEYEGRGVELTRNELRVLHLLMENKGAIISRQELMMELWQSDAFIDDNTLTVNVNRLRKSLASIGVPDGFLATRRGQGYLV